MRHNDKCRGVIKNGICCASGCGEQTLGEANFYISMMLSDLEDKNRMYNLVGYKASGEAIFPNMSAQYVQDMTTDAVMDILEDWSEVPINVHAIVEYDIIKGRVRVSPYNLVRMPLDYLTEYM